MAETTGGNSGASGGSAGSGQVENLVIGVQAQGAPQAEQQLDSFANAVIKVGTATVRSMTTLADLNKAIDENAQWTDKSRAGWDALNKSVNAEYEAEQKALQITVARIDAATKFEAKLQEMVTTFGFSKTEMLAYQAAELGVLDSTKGLIDSLDKLTESQRQNAIQQQRDIQAYREYTAEFERTRKIQEDRDTWEHDQRTKSHNDYVSFWQKQLATQDENDKKYLAAEQARVDREKEINQQRDVWLNNQRQKDRTSYEQWWGDQLKGQETALQKQLALDISYGEKSLAQKIATLQKIAAYQADARTSQAGVDLGSMFGQKALEDVSKLDAMVKEYNNTLGKHGKKLGEAGEATNLFTRALENNRIRTEAVVLAHEALQGRFTRMPGSLMVMGEYLTAANIPLGAMVGYALAAAAALAGVAYEMYKGEEQARKFNDALNRTNGFSGETRSSLEQLAHTVGSLHGSYSAAYEAAEKLTASGKFTGDQIRMITDSAVALEHTMGVDLNTTIKEFETLAVKGTTNAASGAMQVSKALEKLDEQYHFVNSSQMQAIVNLEKEGQYREAADMAIRAYVDETARAAEESEKYTTMMAFGWRGIKSVLNELQQGFVDLFKGQSLAQQKAELLKSMAHNSDGSIKTDNTFDPLQAYRLSQLAELDEAIKKEGASAKARQEKAEQQSVANRAIVMRGVEDRTLMKKSMGELADALDKNKAQLESIMKDNPEYINDPKNVQYESDRVMAIIKAHTQKVAAAKNDGRKEDLLADLQHQDALLAQQENSIDAQLKGLKDQYKKGSVGQEDYYTRTTELRRQDLVDLENNEKAKLAIIDKYTPRNDVDKANVAKRRKQVEDDYNTSVGKVNAAQGLADQQNNEAQFDKWIDGINKTADAEVKAIDQMTKKQEEHNLTIGKTKDQIDDAKNAADDAATKDLKNQADAIEQLLTKGIAHKAYVDGLQEEEDVQINLDNRTRQVYEAELARINNLIQARERYSSSLSQGSILEAQAAAQKQIDSDWKKLDKKIEDDLASAIVDGGGKGFKKLIHDMEVAFAKMVLQPILAPISASFTSAIYPNATQAGGVAGADGTSGVGGAISAANTAATAYKALSGGFTGLNAGIGGSIANLGNMTGMGGLSAFGNGLSGSAAAASEALGAPMTTAAGYGAAAAPYVSMAAGAIGGHYIGGAISGQYGSQSTVNITQSVGTAIGAAVGGPIGAAIGSFLGGTVGGVLNRAFGMGNKDVTATGIRGTLSDSGVTGEDYSTWHQDGGWFRSDKNGTDTSALDTQTINSLSTGLATMKSTVSGLAETLGVGNSALNDYSKSFDIQLTALKEVKGTTAEQTQIQADNLKIQQDNAKKITDYFTSVGDDMASKLIPNISSFAQVGETASTTLERLNTVFKQTNDLAAMLGKSSASLFGSNGLDSDAARERLVNLAGGSSNLSSYAQNYSSNFLTNVQKIAPAQEAVAKAMDALGLSSVKTREQFAQTVSALDLTKQKDSETFISLMKVADAFATVTPAIEDTTKTVQQVYSERKDLQDEYDSLTLTSTQLLQKQRDALDDSNRALFDQVNAIKAMKDAASSLTSNVDAAFGVLQKLVDKQKNELTKAKDTQDKLYDSKISASSTIFDSAKTLSDDLKGTLSSMKLDDAQTQVDARKAAQATIQSAVNSARSGKGLPTDSAIKDALGTLSQSANKDSFASREDYLRDFYRTRNTVGILGNAAGTQEDTQQKILDTLNAQKQAYDDGIDKQLADLDNTLSAAQDQIDEMKGQSTSLISIDQGVQALLLAISTASNNPLVSSASAINNAYQTSLGRAPDQGGLDFWNQQISNGSSTSDVVNAINTSTEAELRKLYQTTLGRDPDPAGLSFWMNAYGSKMDSSEVADWLKAAQKDPGYTGKLPSFDVGTNNVPYNMVAQIHEGEAIIPKADNRALRSAVTSNVTSSMQVVAALTAVQQEIAAFRVENKAGMIASQRDSSSLLNKIKRWDGDGMPATRTITAG